MLFDYNKADIMPMWIQLSDGRKIEGMFADVRIKPETLPAGCEWYHIRHADDDWGRPASIKDGCVIVNHYGTFVCPRIEGFDDDEIEIVDWAFL